jgi:hypothetical protein
MKYHHTFFHCYRTSKSSRIVLFRIRKVLSLRVGSGALLRALLFVGILTVVFQYNSRIMNLGLELNACLIRVGTKTVSGFYETLGNFFILMQ